MPLSTDQYKRIMRFLDGEMTIPEMDAFETELNQVPEMRTQLNFEQAIRNSFSRQQMQPGKKTPAFSTWWALAAAILALVLVIPFLFKSTENKTAETNIKPAIQLQQDSLPPPDSSASSPAIIKDPNPTPTSLAAQLFKQFYTKDTVPDNYPVLLAEAFENYEAGNYNSFKQLKIDELPETRSNGEENTMAIAYYFKGLSYLQSGNTREAIQHLNWVAYRQPDKQWQEKAKWYLILSYLKENKREQCLELCKQMKTSGNNPELVHKATQLINRLDNP